VLSPWARICLDHYGLEVEVIGGGFHCRVLLNSCSSKEPRKDQMEAAGALVLGLKGEQHRIEKGREREELKLLGLEETQKWETAMLCRLERLAKGKREAETGWSAGAALIASFLVRGSWR